MIGPSPWAIAFSNELLGHCRKPCSKDKISKPEMENGKWKMGKRYDRNRAGVFRGDKSAVFSGFPTGSVKN
ncbi:MAG: hypothetical protein KAV82_11465 [Phycisphaerae bacterium]|nr:hypothetical protein [Phycisphaerae bacterium]